MSNLHKIELQIGFCDAVLSGDKCFEVRKNDRGYQKGDYVQFIPVDVGSLKKPYHEVQNKVYLITYVLGGWGLPDNYVAFGIKEARDELQFKEE
jgi:hypothetical protein